MGNRRHWAKCAYSAPIKQKVFMAECAVHLLEIGLKKQFFR